MSANPYESPQPERPVDEPPIEPDETDDWFAYRVVAACYPLPFLFALAAWLSFPYFFFKLPLPVVPFLVSGIAIGTAVMMTQKLTDRMLLGPILRPILSILYILAIIAAWPLAVWLYKAAGFHEPFP